MNKNIEIELPPLAVFLQENLAESISLVELFHPEKQTDMWAILRLCLQTEVLKARRTTQGVCVFKLSECRF